MKTNYWNPKTREYGHVVETKATGAFNGEMSGYCANYKNKRGGYCTQVCKTFKNADAIMAQNGYVRNGIIDESGARRYTMTRDELQDLYKRMENFVADCTRREYEENQSAISAVYTLIHEHINAEIGK